MGSGGRFGSTGLRRAEGLLKASVGKTTGGASAVRLELRRERPSWTVKAFPSEDWPGGWVAAVWFANVATAVRVSPPSAASAVDASARFVAFSPRQHSAALTVDGPAPAFAGASHDPAAASGKACPVVAGIFGLTWHLPYLESEDGCEVEDPYRLSMTYAKNRRFIADLTGSCGDPSYASP